MLIAVNNCFDVCDTPDQWGPGQVLYNGAFNPQPNNSAPQKGHYQDFVLQLPGLQPGGAFIQVAHQFKEGGVCPNVTLTRILLMCMAAGDTVRRLRLFDGLDQHPVI